jgi:DHA1 family tetracycline resistance protein-like MFS transporter
LLAGLSAGSQGVAQAAVVDFAQQNEKPIFISLIAVGMTTGLIVGPLVASFWMHAASWIPFAVGIFLGFISIILLQFQVRESKPIFSRSIKKFLLKDLLKKPGMFRLLSLFLLFELGWSLFYQALPLWLSLHWHLKNTQLGLINSYIGVLLALFLLLGTRLGLRFFTLSTLIQFGFWLGALALIFLSQALTLPIFFVLSFPIVLTIALIYPSILAELSDICGLEQQGLLMGISDALLAFSFAVTGIVSSLLMYFNPVLPFLLAAFFWGIAGLGSIKFKKRLHYATLSRCR